MYLALHRNHGNTERCSTLEVLARWPVNSFLGGAVQGVLGSARQRFAGIQSIFAMIQYNLSGWTVKLVAVALPWSLNLRISLAQLASAAWRSQRPLWTLPEKHAANCAKTGMAEGQLERPVFRAAI
ncbi:uncharacterized protein THITE_2106739 [Thermothielavioides terrestris NRRL 8126]|uniref:Uncharacterized protein n=1 Tax=Thermothielavioides terrestris (strain ATCC 38088 / NRRL 8126) TaxID=578455 RepID=G2QRG3_THETT|nr:uncharacterized protein THITE_2106739 [Thermothielavioides terrestris NRRL 8126]AEO62508.1 hypothetical protein THITE_2106739 [Thermothielavioides terrestris NRRL 8126]